MERFRVGRIKGKRKRNKCWLCGQACVYAEHFCPLQIGQPDLRVKNIDKTTKHEFIQADTLEQEVNK